jgi:hypothetical protein
MSKSNSRWRFLNPMEMLKAIYGTIGTPHPKLSLIAVFIIFGGLATGIWWFVGKQVEKDHQTPPQASIQSVPAATSGAASTSGDNSPANTGNGNTFNNDQPPPKKK